MDQAKALLALACVAYKERKFPIAAQLFATAMSLKDESDALIENLASSSEAFEVIASAVVEESPLPLPEIISQIQEMLSAESAAHTREELSEDEEDDLEMCHGEAISSNSDDEDFEFSLDEEDDSNDELPDDDSDESEESESDEDDLDEDMESESSSIKIVSVVRSPISLK